MLSVSQVLDLHWHSPRPESFCIYEEGHPRIRIKAGPCIVSHTLLKNLVTKAIKFSEENTGKNLHNIGFVNGFLKYVTKSTHKKI